MRRAAVSGIKSRGYTGCQPIAFHSTRSPLQVAAEQQDLMAFIGDREAGIFKEASISAIDNFTSDELETIGVLANTLKGIMEDAKERQQDHLRKMGWG